MSFSTSIGLRPLKFNSQSRVGYGLDLSTGTAGAVFMWDRQLTILGFSFDYDEIGEKDTYAFGTEMSFLEMFQFRYGINYNVFFYKQRASTYGFGVHWEFGQLLVQLDYAHVEANAGLFGQVDEDILGAVVGAHLW